MPLDSGDVARGGIYKVVTGTDPAANTEFSQTVPAGKAWKLFGVAVELVQGATQTPWPGLIIDDGTNVLFSGVTGTAAQNASFTARHYWAPGLAIYGVGSTIRRHGPLPPDWVLPAGFRIRSDTTGIGANSDYGAPSFYVVEFDTD